jgi:hypothetical protein
VTAHNRRPAHWSRSNSGRPEHPAAATCSTPSIPDEQPTTATTRARPHADDTDAQGGTNVGPTLPPERHDTVRSAPAAAGPVITAPRSLIWDRALGASPTSEGRVGIWLASDTGEPFRLDLNQVQFEALASDFNTALGS